MNIWKKFITTFFILTVSGAAFGVTLEWKDVDLAGLDNFVFLQKGDVYKGTFNIIKDGYDPATMQVDWAKAFFAFSDDRCDGAEKVTVKLDGVKLFTKEEVDGNFWAASFDWLKTGLSGSFLASLQDGILKYKIKVTKGDTFLEEAKLKASGSFKAVSDSGSTFVLLGLGLVGLGLMRRKRA